MSWNRSLRLAIVFAVCLPQALAQQNPHAHHESVGYVPREILERAVKIRKGVGRVHETVKTGSPEAQVLYDQGLAYLHSYVWVEAARCFNQSLRLDPNITMAHVGLSRAYSGLNDRAAARAALENAKSLSGKAVDPERRRVALRSQQLDAIDDLANVEKLKAYRKAIDEALALNANDAELWLLRGNAEEPSAAGRGQRGGRESITFYEKALAVSPNNFAAHHYLIHSCENIGDMECALRHGKEYARQAFAIPHARHMYGHDLRRVGRIEEAIEEFTRADQLERAYYDGEKISSDYDWHHQHNLDLLSTSYQYQGRLMMAEKLMSEAFAIPSVDDGREFAKKEWPRFLLGRGRLNEALVAAKALANGKYPGARTIGHVIVGQVLLEMNKTAEAVDELRAAEKQLQEVPRVASGVSTSQGIVEPELKALRSEILLRTGKMEEGRAMFKEVERGLRALLGPDAWSQALFRLESIAHLARSLGDWELARHTAAQMVEHDAAYAGSHYALALVAEHDGDAATAQREFALAARHWGKADPDLAELKVIESKIASRLR